MWSMSSHTTMITYFFFTFWIFILWKFSLYDHRFRWFFWIIWINKTITVMEIIIISSSVTISTSIMDHDPFRLKFTIFASKNDFVLVNQDSLFFINNSLFCTTTRRHEISSEYFLKSFSQYCYSETYSRYER